MTNIQFFPSAIDASGSVSNGWELVKGNYGLFLGISLIAVLLTGCIPCINIFLAGPILGGVFYVMLRQIAGEPVEFGMMFKGFEKFVPLMVIGIIQAVPEVIGQVLRFGVQFGQAGLNSRGSGSGQFFQASQSPFSGIATGVLILFGLIALVVLIVAVVWRFLLFFAIPIAMEHDLGPVDAMKLSARAASANVGGLIVLFIFEFLVTLLGALLCGVGIFFLSIPVIYAANAFAYRQVFPRGFDQQFNPMPPPPTAYGSSFGSGM